MAQWIRIEQDDAALLSVVMDALSAAGYTASPAAAPLFESADIALSCAPVATKTVSLGEFVLDLDRRVIVSGGDKETHFTPTEWDVLVFLARHAHRVVSRKELLAAVWDLPDDTRSRVADDTVKRLRRKLSACSVSIETVWGFGFRLVARKLEEPTPTE